MNKYSIKDLEKITGIKAHTIRMWEKRYGIICPKRTATNIRYYSDKDLKKLMNISTLNRSGLKISEIVDMSSSEICNKIIEVSSSTSYADVYIKDLMISTIELNEKVFNNVISSCVLKFGIERTFAELVFPFLEKVGTLWQAGSINPAQEHFISNLLRQKIIVAIDNLEAPETKNSKSIVLFLPENELHEIALLVYYYLFKKQGYFVVYLGQAVPVNDLKRVLEIHNTDFLLTIFTTGQTKEQLQQYINNLSANHKDKMIFISGLQVKNHNIETPSNIHIIKDYSDILEIIS